MRIKIIGKYLTVAVSVALNITLGAWLVIQYAENEYWRGVSNLNRFAQCYEGRTPFPDDHEKIYKSRHLMSCKDFAEIIDNENYPKMFADTE